MQRIPPFLRSWQIAVAILIVFITMGVLFSRFAAQPDASVSDPAALQPMIAQEAPLEGNDTAAQLEQAPAPAAATPVSTTIVVYITGAVRAPDVYTLPAEARVKDLVMAAGGLTADADAERINLADRLKDADHIRVPRQGEATNPVAADVPPGTNVATKGDELLNINTASVDELDALPGIGPAFAQRIVDYRMTNGPFASINDLSNVKGIGPTLLKEIAPRITTGPP